MYFRTVCTVSDLRKLSLYVKINQFLSCQTLENMSRILILFALFALAHAVFERTDCSCTCKDGKVCVKTVPNYLEGETNECQCKDGTCPSGLEFNGKFHSCQFSRLKTLKKSVIPVSLPFHEFSQDLFHNKNSGNGR